MTRRLRLLERPLPVHLLIGPLAPLLAVTAFSLRHAPSMPSTWSVAGLWLSTLVVLGVLTCVTRNVRTSAAVLAAVMIGFFVDFTTIGLTRFVLEVPVAIWTAVLVVSVLLVVGKREAPGLIVFANVFFALVALGFCFQVVSFRFTAGLRVKPGRLHLAASVQSARPDIYLFVLDGYARGDVLKRIYQYDDPFVSHLRKQGFYVADLASSNYAQTALSLASSLNLDYLPALIDGVPGDAVSRVPCRDLIRGNRMTGVLRDAGYRIVTFASEYSVMRFTNADKEYEPPFYLTQTGGALFTAGPLPGLSELLGLPSAWLPHQVRRYHVQWTFDRLSQCTQTMPDQPTFVFAHIMLPHPPFVFRADGSYTWTRSPAGNVDADHWRRAQPAQGDSYEAGYQSNVEFLGRQMGPIVDGILARATRPTVVLIQADHGSGSRLVWDNADVSDVNERLGILLAMKFSGGHPPPLYPTLTPVNAMRLLLNHAVGTKLALVDDRAYFSTWSHPYQFIDVTDKVRRRLQPVVPAAAAQ